MCSGPESQQPTSKLNQEFGDGCTHFPRCLFTSARMLVLISIIYNMVLGLVKVVQCQNKQKTAKP